MEKNLENNIQDLLKQFQTYWNESLNGDYKNGTKLKSLAIKIKKMDCSNNTVSSLTVTEYTSYAHALLLANIK